MSERDRGDGNTDAPRVDTQYGERSGVEGGATGGASRSGAGEAGSGSGPRRVSETQTDRGSGGRDADRGGGEDGRGTSWISVVIGWLTALGASLLLAGIVGAVVGAILGGDQAAGQEAQSGGASGLIGLLITLLLAFLIGGYAAGRRRAVKA